MPVPNRIWVYEFATTASDVPEDSALNGLTGEQNLPQTARGLEKLGGGDTNATGNKTPGVGVGLLSMLATHNPLGLIVSTGMKVHDEKTGEATISGRVKQTVTEIAGILKKRFKQEGWIY